MECASQRFTKADRLSDSCQFSHKCASVEFTGGRASQESLCRRCYLHIRAFCYTGPGSKALDELKLAVLFPICTDKSSLPPHVFNYSVHLVGCCQRGETESIICNAQRFKVWVRIEVFYETEHLQRVCMQNVCGLSPTHNKSLHLQKWFMAV